MDEATVEKMARALADRRLPIPWDEVSEGLRESYRDDARAALAAMAEAPEPPRVECDEDGIDDLFLSVKAGDYVHLERMSDGQFWMKVGSYRFNFATARGAKIRASCENEDRPSSESWGFAVEKGRAE